VNTLTVRIFFIVFILTASKVPKSFSNQDNYSSRYPNVGVFESNGKIFSRANSRFLTPSSRSKQAAKKKAVLLAKYQIITRELESMLLLLDIPIELKERLLDYLLKENIIRGSLSSFFTVSSGLDEKLGWAIVRGEKSEFKLPKFEQIIALILAENNNSKINPDYSDILYEVGTILRLEGTTNYWFQSLSHKVKAQIKGESPGKVLKCWSANIEFVKDLNFSTLKNSELKKVLELTPYNKKAANQIVESYKKKGMVNCASQFKKIKACIQLLSNKELNDKNSTSWCESKSLKIDKYPLVRILNSSQSIFPEKETKPKALFVEAFESFVVTTGDLNETLNKAFRAVDESICSDTLNLVGAILIRKDCHELALLFLSQAVAMNVHHRYALVNVALCLDSLNRRDEAVTHAHKAKQLSELDDWGKLQVKNILERRIPPLTSEKE